jgi:hypothetical protein
MSNPLLRIVRFYVNGFRHMTWGRTLWFILLIKVFVIFGVLKLFFFPDFLGSRCTSESEKSQFVATQLIHRMDNPKRR